MAAVPSISVAALMILLTAGVALVLIAIFGHETRGRDLRELEALARGA
jgi:putative MFS transporter